MGEFLRKYWFVSVLAVLFIGVLIYYVVDMNKDNVNTLHQADGTDVVISTTAGNVTSTELMDNSTVAEPGILFSLYRNAVTDQTIETTSEIEEQAKTMQKNLESNIKADATGKTKASIMSQLAGMGFSGDNAIAEYSKVAAKIQVLDGNFIREHIDLLSSYVPEGARTISILTMNVEDAANLSDDEKAKQEEIQNALDDGQSFGEVAAEYSDDTDTKDKNGFYGYIDSSNTALDSAVLEKALALNAGDTSEWITVESSSPVLYMVHVEETDADKILESDDDTAVTSLVNTIISKVNGLEAFIIQNAGQKLNVTFANDEIKTQIDDYINQQTSQLDPSILALNTSEDKEEDKTSSESAADSSESAASASSQSDQTSSTASSQEGE
ncbi:peptidylprolyl isomerase [Erysipelotrichaceae bacterium 51-3]|uniref:peptidylprolyl isomerase n=1 Tax=Allobaculum sp. JKK-2023 TaxID=3108943 RepID=UPI002B0593E0|nr:peptidylprolyl isomerase [Allobaculum sp. JKK-2023]